jgi:hypothetical protein
MPDDSPLIQSLRTADGQDDPRTPHLAPHRLAQAAWAMLCALLIVQVPWSERTAPLVIFWVGLVTMWFDRRKAG